MNERYAVMSADLKSISFWDDSLDVCKKYCRPGSVIVERRPAICGFTVHFWPRPWSRWEYWPKLIGIVYRPGLARAKGETT